MTTVTPKIGIAAIRMWKKTSMYTLNALFQDPKTVDTVEAPHFLLASCDFLQRHEMSDSEAAPLEKPFPKRKEQVRSIGENRERAFFMLRAIAEDGGNSPWWFRKNRPRVLGQSAHYVAPLDKNQRTARIQYGPHSRDQI